MKNLNPLNTLEINDYNSVKNSKHTDTRNRLNLIQHLVVNSYNNYINNFATIHLMGPSTFSDEEGDDLRNCYKSKTVARDRLLTRIIDVQTVHFKHTCPYCLLLNRSTFDHYIPEETYPVFSILSKNLIPCCSTCNSKKLEYWRLNGSRTILHYYFDFLPNTQFLFGTLTFSPTNLPYITYSLNQPINISNSLFTIIQSHFDRLTLLDRYQDHLDMVVSDIIDDVATNRLEFGNLVTTQAIANIILNRSNRNKLHYGINHWKSVAMDLLANSAQFLNTL